MTADVELLPLPLPWDPFGRTASVEELRKWCLANVAHATAARDAEVEALRAEVERLEDESQSRLEACGDAVSKLCAAEARAERLAEALRGWIWARENGANEELAVQYARAALEQESNDA